MGQIRKRQKTTGRTNLFLFFVLFVVSGACTKTEKANLYKSEDVESINQQIRNNEELHQDADKVARLYYSQQYPKFNNANLTVSSSFKENYLYVELVEKNLADGAIDAVKLTLVFDRPMGRLKVHKIKHSWKCKNKSLFSAEPCKP
jgi:hypothetical protein